MPDDKKQVLSDYEIREFLDLIGHNSVRICKEVEDDLPKIEESERVQKPKRISEWSILN